jgi:Cu/Zn superoxide dismutase
MARRRLSGNHRRNRRASGASRRAADVTLAGGRNALLDADGTALVLHEGADDYKSDPAGSAGKWLACGVIRR